MLLLTYSKCYKVRELLYILFHVGKGLVFKEHIVHEFLPFDRTIRVCINSHEQLFELFLIHTFLNDSSKGFDKLRYQNNDITSSRFNSPPLSLSAASNASLNSMMCWRLIFSLALAFLNSYERQVRCIDLSSNVCFLFIDLFPFFLNYFVFIHFCL